MVKPLQFFKQQSLTEADLDDNLNPLPIPEDTLQLQVDMLNVIAGVVELKTFPHDYQERIKYYYRFSATRMYTGYTKPANITKDTLDII